MSYNKRDKMGNKKYIAFLLVLVIISTLSFVLSQNNPVVYQGDIIKNCDTNELQYVYWNHEKAAWFCKYIECKRIVSLCHSLENCNYKIGNIFDNPDLIK